MKISRRPGWFTMKNLIAIAASFLLVLAAVSADEPVVAVTIDELRANPSLFESHRYISTGQPDEEILALAKAAGYVAVIDLRTAEEDRGIDEAIAAESAGLAYHWLPVAGAKGTTYENARALDELVAGIEGPILLHCRSGNRVGALLALTAGKQGASEEEALEIGRRAGLTSLEPVVIERLRDE